MDEEINMNSERPSLVGVTSRVEQGRGGGGEGTTTKQERPPVTQ